MLRKAIILSAVFAVACGEKDHEHSGHEHSGGDDSVAQDDSGGSDDTGQGESECFDRLETDASLTGQVLDASGSPITTASVQLCWQLCRQVSVDGSGGFSFSTAEAHSHALKVFPDGWIEGDTAVFSMPIQLEPGGNSITVTLPDYDVDYQTIPASTPAELNLDGLYVTTSMANLSFDFGVDTNKATGVMVPQDEWPEDWQLPAEASGAVVAAWYTHPYNTVANEPMPVRIAAPEGEHATYGLWESHWHVESCEVKWEKTGTFTRDGDWLVNTEVGLHKFTTVVLVEE